MIHARPAAASQWHAPATPGAQPVSRRYIFVLLDQFTHLAFSFAIEPLRLANYVTGQELYSWETRSVDGKPVRASNGLGVMVDGGLGPLGRHDRLIVVGGLSPRASLTPEVRAFLRRQQAHGSRIVGICGATEVLAASGILQGQPCAVHWDVRDAFAERHPELPVTTGVYTLDRVPTAAGGAASGDLVLHLIGVDHGKELAARVADLMVYPAMRDPQSPQTRTPLLRTVLRQPGLATAVRLMAAHLEAPLSMTEIARQACTSVRQLERLFLRHFKTSPKRHYMDLRMAKARRLLAQTDLPVTEIAIACGFASPSHFSKKYRAHFGAPACRQRRAIGQDPIRDLPDRDRPAI